MDQILLNGISLNELLNCIGELIDDKLASAKSVENKETKYLGRQEVCTLLKISLPTLNDWTKLGRLRSYKIGTRVLYKVEEVENSLHHVSGLKFKKGGIYATQK